MHTSLKRYRERKSVAILRNVRRQLNNNCYILVPRWLKIQIYYSSTLILFVSPLWQIIDSGKEKSIGKLEFPLAQLLKSERMTIEQPFPLKESGHNSTLTCKFMLKVNFPVKPLPRFLPKDQCLNFGCCKCLNLTNKSRQTTLDIYCETASHLLFAQKSAWKNTTQVSSVSLKCKAAIHK